MRQWVPRYPQTTEDRCAIAALQAVRGYWLRQNEEEELAALAGTVESGPTEGRGTTAIGVAKAAFAKGVHVTFACAAGAVQWLGEAEETDSDPGAQAWVQHAVQFSNHGEAWQWLQDVVRAGRPVITSINEHPNVNSGYSHSVVVVAATAETVTIIDPEQEPLLREIKPSQFLFSWHAVLYITILLTPQSGGSSALNRGERSY